MFSDPSFIAILLAVTAHGKRMAFLSSNSNTATITTYLDCPVSCGSDTGWCCDEDDICHLAASGNTAYVCEDLLLTQKDG